MLRSYLYVPGDQPSRMHKAAALIGAHRPDALILDLEDAVAATAKAAARAHVIDFIEATTTAPQLIVRINSGALGEEDARAIASLPIAAICVPKASPESVARIGELLESVRSAATIEAIIESAEGLRDVHLIAASPRVATLAIGEADLGSDLGVRNPVRFWPLRMQVIVACAAAGLRPPTAPVSTDFRDLEAFSASTVELREAGFGARPAIHPAQIAAINAVFTPTTDELAAAERVVALYDAALAVGHGAIVDSNGRMLDEAVVRAARRLLNRL